MSKRSESCKNLSWEKPCDMIRLGTLGHASARYELKARGQESLIAKADHDGFREMRRPF